MPKPRRRLDKEVEKSGNWFPSWARNMKFEVTHKMLTDKFVVDLDKHTCSCNFWELVGIFCRHAVAAMSYKVDDPKNISIDTTLEKHMSSHMDMS